MFFVNVDEITALAREYFYEQNMCVKIFSLFRGFTAVLVAKCKF